MCNNRITNACSVVACAIVMNVSLTQAAPISFTAASGDRAASATFEASGNDLVVTLTNVSTVDVLIPIDVLTALFFDVDASPSLALSPTSAVLGSGSSVLFGGTDPGDVVGGEWAYVGGLVGAPGGREYGISSTGLGLFGPDDRFPGSNLQGPDAPDGVQYGLTSAGDNPLTGNTPVTGANALIQNQVVFTLSGLPVGFDPSAKIENVVWQYGTGLDEPRIPEPATVIFPLSPAGTRLLRRQPTSPHATSG